MLLPSGHRFLISPVTLQGPCNTRLTLQVATPLSLTHTSKSCIFTLKIMHFLLFIFHLENSVILWSNANWEVVFFFFNNPLQIDGDVLAPPGMGYWPKARRPLQWLNFKWLDGFTIQGTGTVDGQSTLLRSVSPANVSQVGLMASKKLGCFQHLE